MDLKEILLELNVENEVNRNKNMKIVEKKEEIGNKILKNEEIKERERKIDKVDMRIEEIGEKKDRKKLSEI